MRATWRFAQWGPKKLKPKKSDGKSKRLGTDKETEAQEITRNQRSNLQKRKEATENQMERAGDLEREKEKEAIFSKLEKLRIEEKNRIVAVEDEDIEDTNKELLFSTACKILSERSVNEEYFVSMMPRIWGIEGYVKIESAGKNIFQCDFKFLRDKTRIIRGGPWSFDNALLIFEELRGNYSLNSIDFRYVSFWVHFLNLPRVCFL